MYITANRYNTILAQSYRPQFKLLTSIITIYKQFYPFKRGLKQIL